MSARALALLAGVAGAFACAPAEPPATEIALGAQHEDRLELAHERAQDFVIAVDGETVALRIEVESSAAELDVWVRAGERPRVHDEADFHVATEAGVAAFSIDRFTEPALAPGRWYVRVSVDAPHRAHTAETWLHEIPFTIRALAFRTRTDAALAPGLFAAGIVDAQDGGFRSYTIDVPVGARALRVDVAGADQDLDLLARAGAPCRVLDESTALVQHFYGSETLVLTPDSDPPLVPGRWFVDVVDAQGAELAVAFRLRASFEPEPPAELLGLPTFTTPPSSSPLARALAAVVEITTDDGVGSGTIVSRDGWIVTNAHVVAGFADAVEDEVVVALPLALDRPPVECFHGRVARIDRERDLALVKIERGFYGQPLPDGYAFPTVEIGDADALAIGDPLWLLGYPWTGGQGTRVTVHCTRGIVAGFERAPFGRVVKTDAEINSGNSGGAALDSAGRIVGVPTSVAELGSGQTGFVHPLSALPPAWLADVSQRIR